MTTERSLLVSGTVLLAIAALVGFIQRRHREDPTAFARWRVVHAGGTAGAVQLLALSAVWARFGFAGPWAPVLAWGLILATWAFFVGPLATALNAARTARAINLLGAFVGFPAYLALPFVVV